MDEVFHYVGPCSIVNYTSGPNGEPHVNFAREVKVSAGKIAQYDLALEILWLPPGKRLWSKIDILPWHWIATFRLICAGHVDSEQLPLNSINTRRIIERQCDLLELFSYLCELKGSLENYCEFDSRDYFLSAV